MIPKYKSEVAQIEAEIKWLGDIFAREGVRSYLELGCRYGGSLWRVALALPVGSLIVAVDLPGGFGARVDGPAILKGCLAELERLGYRTSVVWGDTTDKDVVEEVRALGPFDACLIDARHTLPYVTKDWENYGPMCRMVAFHDIAWRRGADFRGPRIHVPEFWNSIKDDYRHEEIKLDRQDNGIGVLWRP